MACTTDLWDMSDLLGDRSEGSAMQRPERIGGGILLNPGHRFHEANGRCRRRREPGLACERGILHTRVSDWPERDGIAEVASSILACSTNQ
jgi:hypothetical protein